jgi:hypothetical protein
LVDRGINHFPRPFRFHRREHLFLKDFHLFQRHYLAQSNGLSADLTSQVDILAFLAGLNRGPLSTLFNDSISAVLISYSTTSRPAAPPTHRTRRQTTPVFIAAV